MPDVDPDSEDLNAELERQLTEQEVRDLLNTEEYRRYQEDASLLDLLSGEKVKAIIQESDIQNGATDDSTESDTAFEDSHTK